VSIDSGAGDGAGLPHGAYRHCEPPRLCGVVRNGAPAAQHVVVNRSACSPELAFASVADLQYHMHAVQPDAFPLPFSADGTAGAGGVPEGCVAGGLHTRFFAFRGKHEQWLQDVPALPDVAKAVEAVRAMPGVVEACKGFRSLVAGDAEGAAAADPRGPASDAAITLLGTASAVPGRYRNVSGILLSTCATEDSNVPGWIALLDAGEGTLGSMYRKYGDGLPDALRNLRVAFITHMHADHHLGLVSILIERAKVIASDEAPLLVVGPRKLHEWLSRLGATMKLSFRFVPCGDVTRGRRSEAVQAELARGGLTSLTAVEVIHCHSSYGVVLERCKPADVGDKSLDASTVEPFTVVYSGDCRPSDSLIDVGQGATVLIHDATFDGDMLEDAKKKKHSTIPEALGVGVAMGAKYTVLSHFSGRKQNCAPNVGDDAAVDTRAIMAHDGMHLNLGRLDEAANGTPAISAMLTHYMKRDIAE